MPENRYQIGWPSMGPRSWEHIHVISAKNPTEARKKSLKYIHVKFQDGYWWGFVSTDNYRKPAQVGAVIAKNKEEAKRKIARYKLVIIPYTGT